LAVGDVVPSGSPESLLARIEGVLIPSEVELQEAKMKSPTATVTQCRSKRSPRKVAALVAVDLFKKPGNV
jgi:hypothetical protein